MEEPKERNPLPRPPKPAPKPETTSTPRPEPKLPSIPFPQPKPEKPQWKKLCLQLAAAFGAGAVVGKLFLPDYAIIILEALKTLLNALGG